VDVVVCSDEKLRKKTITGGTPVPRGDPYWERDHQYDNRKRIGSIAQALAGARDAGSIESQSVEFVSEVSVSYESAD